MATQTARARPQSGMQLLFTLLSQLGSKVWVVIVVTAVAGTASAVFYFWPNGGPNSGPGGRPVQVVQVGPATLSNAGKPLPVVPEPNAGLVLMPVVAAMLLFSSRRLWSARRCPAPLDKNTVIEP